MTKTEFVLLVALGQILVIWAILLGMKALGVGELTWNAVMVPPLGFIYVAGICLVLEGLARGLQAVWSAINSVIQRGRIK